MQLLLRRYTRDPLIYTALFAMFWVIARACRQSITIDEADSYHFWVSRFDPSHWEAASNNHVLNSMLERLVTGIFGVSHLTVRAPALLGAAIYILAALYLCKVITIDKLLQWTLFAGLVYNPFVMDHLVAARGYSLALGFLLAAIAFAFSDRPPLRVAALSSLCIGLSFAANFSFAFVNAAVTILILVWLSRHVERKAYPKLAIAGILPGLAVSALLTISTLLNWPRAELYYGAHSLSEMFGSVLESSLYKLNPYIVNPLLYPVIEKASGWLPALLGAALVGQAAGILLKRVSPPKPHAAWLLIVAAGAFVISVGAHRLAYGIWGLPMPLARTAVFFAPLFMLTAGVLASALPVSRIGGVLRRSVLVTMFAAACYFVLCLRLSYFKEWKWNADCKHLYDVVAYYNQTYGVKDIGTSWRFGACLNFYRELSGKESMSELQSFVHQYPPGKPMYVLIYPFDQGFVEQEGLKVVYQGELSGAVVAIRPGVELAEGKLSRLTRGLVDFLQAPHADGVAPPGGYGLGGRPGAADGRDARDVVGHRRPPDRPLVAEGMRPGRRVDHKMDRPRLQQVHRVGPAFVHFEHNPGGQPSRPQRRRGPASRHQLEPEPGECSRHFDGGRLVAVVHADEHRAAVRQRRSRA